MRFFAVLFLKYFLQIHDFCSCSHHSHNIVYRMNFKTCITNKYKINWSIISIKQKRKIISFLFLFFSTHISSFSFTMEHLAKCIFLGTGTSEGVPLLSCMFKDCAVCKSALIPGSKNRRRNISVVLSYKSTNVIIDISLFAYDSMILLFPLLFCTVESCGGTMPSRSFPSTI